MFQSVKSVYSALGVMLFLVAMYLVLTQAGGATKIISSVASGANATFKTLQGRG